MSNNLISLFLLHSVCSALAIYSQKKWNEMKLLVLLLKWFSCSFGLSICSVVCSSPVEYTCTAEHVNWKEKQQALLMKSDILYINFQWNVNDPSETIFFRRWRWKQNRKSFVFFFLAKSWFTSCLIKSYLNGIL